MEKAWILIKRKTDSTRIHCPRFLSKWFEIFFFFFSIKRLLKGCNKLWRRGEGVWLLSDISAPPECRWAKKKSHRWVRESKRRLSMFLIRASQGKSPCAARSRYYRWYKTKSTTSTPWFGGLASPNPFPTHRWLRNIVRERKSVRECERERKRQGNERERALKKKTRGRETRTGDPEELRSMESLSRTYI